MCSLQAPWDTPEQIWGLPPSPPQSASVQRFRQSRPENARSPGRAQLAAARKAFGTPRQTLGWKAGTSESSPPRARQAPLSSRPCAARAHQGTPQPASSLWYWCRRRARKACRDGGSFRSWRWRDWFEVVLLGRKMSQERAVPASAVPLEELSSWSEELCRRELPTVLPRLLISFFVTSAWRGVWGSFSPLSAASSHSPPGRVVFCGLNPLLSSLLRETSEGGKRGREGTMAAQTEGTPPSGPGRARSGVPPCDFGSGCGGFFCTRHLQLNVNTFPWVPREASAQT